MVFYIQSQFIKKKFLEMQTLLENHKFLLRKSLCLTFDVKNKNLLFVV